MPNFIPLNNKIQRVRVGSAGQGSCHGRPTERRLPLARPRKLHGDPRTVVQKQRSHRLDRLVRRKPTNFRYFFNYL